MDESKTECAYQLRLKDNQNVEQIKEINKKARGEKDVLSKSILTLQQDIGNMTKENEGKLQSVSVVDCFFFLFLFQVSALNERTLQDQGDMYKSKLVIEYDKFDGMEAAYNDMKEINKKKTEELERSIEQRVEKIQKEFDKSVFFANFKAALRRSFFLPIVQLQF